LAFELSAHEPIEEQVIMAITMQGNNPLDGTEWPNAYTRAVRLSLDLIPSQYPSEGNQPMKGGPSIAAGLKGHAGFHQWASEAAFKQLGHKANPEFNVFIELSEQDLLPVFGKSVLAAITDDPAVQQQLRDVLTAAGVAEMTMQDVITKEVYLHPKVREHAQLQGVMI